MNTRIDNRTRLLLAAALVTTCSLTAPAFATEGFTEVSTGKTALLSGYATTADEINASPALEIDVNRYIEIEGAREDYYTPLAANDPKVVQFIADINVAIGLWENLPGSRLNFALGKIRALEDSLSKNGINLATMARYSSYLGLGQGHVALNPAGEPRIVERDFTAQVAFTAEDEPTEDGVAAQRAVIAHEIGHTIGLNHSYLANEGIDGGESRFPQPGSIMSYGLHRKDLIKGGALAAEDAAVAARLYPRLSSSRTPNVPTLSRSTGAVQGKVLAADGETEIYGANVLLVKSRVIGVASRISGYADTRPQSSRRKGTFDLDGVPPGTYDLLVAAHDDPIAPNRSPSIFWESTWDAETVPPYAHESFDTGFPVAWVRNITVAAGQTVDVGYVVAGEDRDVATPALNDVTVQHPLDPYEGYTYYWFDFWSTSPWELAHRSGTLTSPRYSTRLKNQYYYVKVYGRGSNTGWYVLQDWKLTDMRARPLDLSWPRPVQLGGSSEVNGPIAWWREALATRVIFRPNISGASNRYHWLNGDAFRSYVVPGTWRYFVQTRYNSSERLQLHQSTQYVEVK